MVQTPMSSHGTNLTRFWSTVLVLFFVATGPIHSNTKRQQHQSVVVKAFLMPRPNPCSISKSCFDLTTTNKRTSTTSLFAAEKKKEQEKKRGYQFGDITKSIAKGITGKNEYEFGDISRTLDTKAKKRIGDVTGFQSFENYKFGDITKELVSNYTNKTSYDLGDVTKEVMRRTASGEYDFNDVLLLLKSMLTLGINFTPLARILPLRVLVQLFNVGLAQELGSRFLEIVASSLDKRFKQALTGNENYELGDVTKDKLKQSISKATGKDEYEFGDLAKTIMKTTDGSNGGATQIKLDQDLSEKLNVWDKNFLDKLSKQKETK